MLSDVVAIVIQALAWDFERDFSISRTAVLI